MVRRPVFMRFKDRFILLSALVVFLCAAKSTFGQPQKIPLANARSAHGPALAVMNGTVFAAWRGAASPNSTIDDQQIYLTSYRDGQWQAPIVLPIQSMFSPALAVHGQTLFLAWHGAGNLFTGTGDPALFLGSYSVADGFRVIGPIPNAASAGPPSLAVYHGVLYAAWRSIGNVTLGMVRGNEHWILYATYHPEKNEWTLPLNIVHANSTSGPSLATVNDKLYAVWRGTGSVTFYGPNSDPGDPLIYYASFDGRVWSAATLPLPTIPGAATAWGAAAATWNGHLCVGWRGEQPWDGAKGDQTLHFAILEDSGSWKPLKLFEGTNPASAFGPFMASSKDSLWIAWRGGFDSGRALDDQSLYLSSFGPAAGK